MRTVTNGRRSGVCPPAARARCPWPNTVRALPSLCECARALVDDRGIRSAGHGDLLGALLDLGRPCGTCTVCVPQVGGLKLGVPLYLSQAARRWFIGSFVE
jgi:hypothetical protein